MSKFSEKHYEEIADLFGSLDCWDDCETERERTLVSQALTHVSARFIEMFEKDNPKFSRKRFMKRLVDTLSKNVEKEIDMYAALKKEDKRDVVG